MRIKTLLSGAAVAAVISIAAAQASAISLKVTITNIAPTGGVYLTPVWIGFHNGSFDSYDGGTASAAELEALAEDGNTGPISGVFASGGTLVTTGTAQTGTRVQTTFGGLLAPGASVMGTFNVDNTGANQYFSYASMVLPSSDYYVANGNPLAHDLSGLTVGSSTSFFIGAPGTVNDAGTEVNNFATSAGNGLFGIAGGQSGANQGANEGGVNTNVTSPFASFLNQPIGGVAPELNFNNYQNGIAHVDVEAVPLPAPIAMMGAVMVGAGLFARRRNKA